MRSSYPETLDLRHLEEPQRNVDLPAKLTPRTERFDTRPPNFNTQPREQPSAGQTAQGGAAVKWYEPGELSQGKAAQVAGLTRAEFINRLARYTNLDSSPRITKR